jgi:hypothetical protein
VRITGLDVAKIPDRELAALRASRIGFVFQQIQYSRRSGTVRTALNQQRGYGLLDLEDRLGKIR